MAFVWLTESGGKNYANDGKAFHPDPKMRREGWDKDDNGQPLPAAVLAACYAAVRKSLDYPHDAVGSNGGSTGGIQQLSQDYVGARFPGKTWGYGTVASTMDPANATAMFLGRLRVTNDRVYAGITFSDPLVADVLRVQQPLVSEHESDNYSLQFKWHPQRRSSLNSHPNHGKDTMPTRDELKSDITEANAALKTDVAELRKEVDALTKKVDDLPAAVWRMWQRDTVPTAKGVEPRNLRTISWLQEMHRLVGYINEKLTVIGKQVGGVDDQLDGMDAELGKLVAAISAPVIEDPPAEPAQPA